MTGLCDITTVSNVGRYGYGLVRNRSQWRVGWHVDFHMSTSDQRGTGTRRYLDPQRFGRSTRLISNVALFNTQILEVVYSHMKIEFQTLSMHGAMGNAPLMSHMSGSSFVQVLYHHSCYLGDKFLIAR